MDKSHRGFTLIEIAIVLVIIGLLLGGVLKGQELINQAKVRNIGNDINGIGAAVYAYQDRYRALPGDDGGAQGRWNLASNQNGDRNGALNNPNTGGGDESALFWLHLRRAGLIAGDAASSAAPFNAANGTSTVHAAAAGFNGVVLCTNNIPGKLAEAVDGQFDDGRPSTGTMRATAANSGSAAADLAPVSAAAYVDDGATNYRLCKQL